MNRLLHQVLVSLAKFNTMMFKFFYQQSMNLQLYVEKIKEDEPKK